MKIVTQGVLTSALVIGLTSVAYAQSANLGASGLGGLGGLQAGGSNGAAAAQRMSVGTGAASLSPTPGIGTMGSTPAIGGTGSVGSGPALSNMRANGTSLNMNPDPRAPNVAGKAFGPQ